tara:strand:+ start:242 stop:1123 length:882 start_codon:yes stop_codon:yes gene_type:complete
MTILEILQCPDCSGAIEQPDDTRLLCQNCSREYPIIDGIYSMLPSHSLKDTRFDNNKCFEQWRKISSEVLHDYFINGNKLFNFIHNSSHKAGNDIADLSDESGWSLDIGCGTGAHFPYYSNLSRVVGIDINLKSLKLIRKSHPTATLIHGDMYFMPLKSDVFKYVFSIYILEHSYFLESAIEETLRILSQDGVFIVGLPCEGGLAWSLGRELTSHKYITNTYGIDYRRIVALEHCNTAKRVLTALEKRFSVVGRKWLPFPFLPSVNLNLTVTTLYKKADENQSSARPQTITSG